jgi:hypothetical protein
MNENWKLERYVWVVKYRLHTHEWLVYYYEVVAMYNDVVLLTIWPLMSMESDDAVVQDSQVYFILEKYIVTIHLWNHKNNHGTVVLRKHPTFVNVMESSHTYNCVHIHALRGYYDCCHWWYCSNMKGNHVSVHNNNSYSCIDMKRLYEM